MWLNISCTSRIIMLQWRVSSISHDNSVSNQYFRLRCVDVWTFGCSWRRGGGRLYLGGSWACPAPAELAQASQCLLQIPLTTIRTNVCICTVAACGADFTIVATLSLDYYDTVNDDFDDTSSLQDDSYLDAAGASQFGQESRLDGSCCRVLF